MKLVYSQVLSSVSGAVKAKVELTNFSFVTGLPVFDRDSYVHWPDRFGVEVITFDVGTEYAVPTAGSLVTGALADNISQAF